ncbi:hypothetical protein B0T16DRAFT_450903 [Cercophora newfieldiana]|uniref:Integral membrane protein n=1 Tax=Cercophora newfieldiana TaxID=92897 RepID=A0AA39YM79_9PEZI|nr:hypothetical protein B0T16DRAFT_450903 [Cercophora newfieldiana]
MGQPSSAISWPCPEVLPELHFIPPPLATVPRPNPHPPLATPDARHYLQMENDNDDRRPMLWAAIVPFFSLSVIVYVVRIFDRWRRKSTLSWVEASITVTMAANVVTIALTAVATKYGFGTHMPAIPETDGRITVLLVVWMVGGVASGFARISIVSVTLRCTPGSGSRSTKSFLLWTVIVFQALSIVCPVSMYPLSLSPHHA